MTKKIVLAYANPDEIEPELEILEQGDFEVIATKGGLVTGKQLTDPDIWPLTAPTSDGSHRMPTASGPRSARSTGCA